MLVVLAILSVVTLAWGTVLARRCQDLRKAVADGAAWHAELQRLKNDELVLCESIAEGHPHFGTFQCGSALKAVQDLRQKYDALRGPAVVPTVFNNPSLQWESGPGAWCDNCGEVYAGD